VKLKKLTSAEISWIVTLILLFIATVYNTVTTGGFGIVGIIFFASLIVYFGSYIANKKKN